jgi:hypothetical protein
MEVEPRELTVSRETPEVEVMENGFTEGVPVRVSLAFGVVVPIPTFPPDVTLSILVPEEEATLNGSKVVVP